jgi:serine/threonine-protein kinase
MTGQKISHYRITRKRGEGGMGVVYEAVDLMLQRKVALKFLAAHALDDPEAKQRFVREARAAASLDHPNVCTVYEIGEEDGQAFLAMPLIEGKTVKELIADRPLPLQTAIDLAIQAAQGLHAAHDRGIVHRDIKSANLIVTPEGVLKVMDFGLAQLAGQSTLTQSRTTLGTAAYMSPEQAQCHQVDQRSDIWSLGVVVYEAVTGRLPFSGDHEAAVLYSIVHSTPEPVAALRADLPADLDRVLRKALAKDPARRYQRIADVLPDLRALKSGGPVSAPVTLRRRDLVIAGGATAGVAIAAAFGLRMRSGAGSVAMSTVMVLPLVNLSGDPEQEYFADGMTDALITDLSKISALQMISRHTAMRYKGSTKPVREIAREVKVRAVVGGSVIREAGRVRITAQLIDASMDQNMWGESYEREMASILSLQAEVARAIAGQVRAKLLPEEETRLAQTRTVNPEVYETYLKALFWMNKGTPEAFDKAVALFEFAVDKDPADPLAYAGLATAYMTAAHLADSPEYKVPRARAAAIRALQLDDRNADAHVALAVIEGYRDWKWQEAEQRLDRAIALNPNSAMAHFQRAWLHSLYGRSDKAIESGKRARELDPLAVIYHWATDFYRIDRQYDKAIEEASRALQANPKLFIARIVLASTYSDLKRHDEAISEFKRATTDAPSLIGYLGFAYAKAGRIEDARSVLARLESMKLSGWNAWFRAVMYTLLGNKDEAFRMLNFQPHHDWLSAIGGMDEFKPLRGDPRYDALVKRMNVPVT